MAVVAWGRNAQHSVAQTVGAVSRGALVFVLHGGAHSGRKLPAALRRPRQLEVDERLQRIGILRLGRRTRAMITMLAVCMFSH